MRLYNDIMVIVPIVKQVSVYSKTPCFTLHQGGAGEERILQVWVASCMKHFN